jgi:hypothetical protein
MVRTSPSPGTIVSGLTPEGILNLTHQLAISVSAFGFLVRNIISSELRPVGPPQEKTPRPPRVISCSLNAKSTALFVLGS